MNMSELVTRIKLNLGLMSIATPFENINDTIKTIIETITIPDFSLYSPWKMSITIDLRNETTYDKEGERTTYILPDFKTHKLLYVTDVRYSEANMTSVGWYDGGGLPIVDGNMYQQAVLTNASSNLLKQMIPKVTYKFEHPNKLHLFNLVSSTTLVCDLAFEHDKSLMSIPNSTRKSFIDLAILDVKAGLYPTLKNYTSLQTAYGQIDLKLDNWENAESDRRELLDRWEDTYHLDVFTPMYYG